MLYIRVDMNPIIATGHVMRCLSIADAAMRAGEETTFILADEQALGFVEEHGHHAVILDTKWNDMERELPVLKKIIREYSIQQLLIDSYQVTAAYLAELSNLLRIIYIDDINAFHYPVNAIICYANYWQKFEYQNYYKDIELFLGMDYVPLRKGFLSCKKKWIRDIPQNLLLLSGGTDNYHILENILSELELSFWKKIDVICGRYFMDYERLKKKYLHKKEVVFHQSVTNIEHFMAAADVAISAGGSTLYELCAMGTPTISYSFADNQLDNVRQFERDGLIAYAGDIRNQDIMQTISDNLADCYMDKAERQARSEKMQQLVDGKGAERIAEILIRRLANTNKI